MNFRLSLKTFIMNGNDTLLIKRASDDVQKPEIWEIPGGRIELGENPFEGLKREVKEETGLEIKIIHPVSVRHFQREDEQTVTMIIFLSQANNKNIKLSSEHTDSDWIPFERCKEKLNKFFHQEVDTINKLGINKP